MKPFTPRPTDPGGRLAFVERLGGNDVERVGVVWSEGSVPSSVWVLPDDDPERVVLVKLPTKLRAERDGRRAKLVASHRLNWQRDVIRRCDAVYRAGGVFGVVDRMVYYPSEGHGPVVSWHADPACPEAANKARYEPSDKMKERGARPTRPAREIILILLGQTYQGGGHLCPRCVFLIEPGIPE